MAYKVIILYQLYMPSYFLGTFTEYPYFRQTNPVFEKKNRNLDKQTAPYNTIKHQRDKQIFIVYRAVI